MLDLLEASLLLERLKLMPHYQDLSASTQRKVTLKNLKQARFSGGNRFEILRHLPPPTSNNIYAEGHARSLESVSTTPDRARALSRVINDLPMTREISSASYRTSNNRQFMEPEGSNGTLTLTTLLPLNSAACITLQSMYTNDPGLRILLMIGARKSTPD